MVSPLRLEWPGQKILDRSVDIKSSIKNSGDGVCDRHLDALLFRHLEQHGRRKGALRQLARRLRGMRCLSLPKRQTKGKVARLRAFARSEERRVGKEWRCGSAR